MDIEGYLKKIENYLAQGINNYNFENIEDVNLMISGLRGLQKFTEAENLFFKYENALRTSEYWPAFLSTILQVFSDNKNVANLIKYTKELKGIYPDHPFVIEISKFHTI